MAWRFQKRIKIAPGIRVNLSKSGISTTTGVNGLSVNKGKDGTHLNLGLPGTGLSSRRRLSGPKDTKPKDAPPGLGATIAGIAIVAAAVWGLIAWLIP